MRRQDIAARLSVIAASLVLLGGCAATTTPPPSASPTSSATTPSPSTSPSSPSAAASPSGPAFTAPTVVHGAPLDPGPKPDEATCEQMIRDEHAAAARIRAALNVNELHSDITVAFTVAKDPKAAISHSEGIPLTDDEVALIEASGSSGWETPLELWANHGASERFGGFWIDPPPTPHFVVAIPPADTRTLALARCLERDDAPIRYVEAAITLDALKAIFDWISEDRGWLRASGIELTSIGLRPDEGGIDVGVHGLTPAIEEFLTLRYGWPVRVHEGPDEATPY